MRANSQTLKLTRAEASEACRQAEREGLLGLFQQAALRLEQELLKAEAQLEECRKTRDNLIQAVAGKW